ncbi:MAG: glycoside hydrolase family 5 protein [Oscillospiraceae bacterium]|nr:glycoside hydrolase family 5 protein [Oscillospiraceae bacterium]
MKKILSAIISAAVLLSSTGCFAQRAANEIISEIEPHVSNEEIISSVTPETAEAPEDNSGEALTTAAGFSVQGTKLIDAKGNEFIMRGLNHPHCWFLDTDDTALPAIAEAGCNTVRIVCGAGIQYNKDTAEMLTEVINKCKELDMVCVLEVHDITGKDDIGMLEKVTDYWIEVKNALIGNEAYVILNIANEWVGQWNSEIWRDGYTASIPRLREAGIKNTIMVDAGGWGQYGRSIADYGMEVFNSDPDKNTMFSVHMYGSAGKNERTIKQNIIGATQQELCIIVGEFGYTHSDGDVNEAYIMQYCEENDIGYLGWSWKGNGGGVEYLDIALEWDGSVLSEDWGEVLINGENGIKATAKICSIYE